MSSKLPPESQFSNEICWTRAARRITRGINTGWWLDRQFPILIGLALLSAAAILCLRTFWDGYADEPLWLLSGTAAVLLLGSFVAFLFARKKFVAFDEGITRLDDELKLRNALTTARAGVGKWPSFEPQLLKNLSLKWRWPLIVVPLLVSILIPLIATYVPIVEVVAESKLPPNEPAAWAQMDDWVDTLEDEDLIEESTVEELREKIEELRAQPEDEWFAHSSMEATDNLRESLARDIQELASDMLAMERDLNALQNHSTQLSEESKEMLLQEYDNALKNLAMNSLEVNQALLQQLQQIDPKQLGQMKMDQLNAEQLNQLREAIKQHGGKLGEMKGLPEIKELSDEWEKWLAEQRNNRGGRGGIQRGRGDAPIFFGQETDLKTEKIEAVKNPDLSGASPGDLLAVGETEHDLEKEATQIRQGGALSNKGRGGETVWKESLMPAEKAVLKRYFK